MSPKKWLLAFLFVLQTSLAYAGCSVGALPFNLQNNTIADATQVMGNFNQIVNGANTNCASSGINNDITSITALSTPLSPGQGGSAVFAGQTTAGSANAQTLTVNSNWSSSVQGYHITGFWGFTNTGPMTISINGGAAINVYRKTQFGISPLQAGGAITAHPFDLLSNGAGIAVLQGEMQIIGEMKTLGVGTPPGWLVADGSSFVCTTFQDLCNVIGTTYGGTSSNPNLPDTRGRVLTGLDNYGTGIGAAGRLNNIITGCGTAFNALGVTCANSSERHFQQGNELAVHNHGVSDPTHNHGVTDPGHNHSIPGGSTFTTNNNGNQASGASRAGDVSGASTVVSNTTGLTVNGNATGITINNAGSGAAMPIVNPNFGVVMVIRF